MSIFSLHSIADYAELIGAAHAMIGTWLLALKTKSARWGWIAYLVSNICWVVFAVQIERRLMLVQMISFTASSLVAIWNFWIVPRYPHLPEFNSQLWRKKTNEQHS